MAPMLMRSNLTIALLACVRECAELAELSSQDESISSLVAKGKECRSACLDCLEAYESTRISIRGLLIHSVSHACSALIKECDQAKLPLIERCMNACQQCIEACACLMDDRDFGMFSPLEDSKG